MDFEQVLTNSRKTCSKTFQRKIVLIILNDFRCQFHKIRDEQPETEKFVLESQR